LTFSFPDGARPAWSEFDPVEVLVIPLAVALVTCWLLTALLIRLAPHLGLVDQPSDRKVHSRATPRGGGLAIFLAVIAGCICAGKTAGGPRGLVGLSLAYSSVIVCLGILDDRFSLSWRMRLGVQVILAASVVYREHSYDGSATALLAFLWIVGMTNAFNMLDNMDALSGGVAVIAAAFLAAAILFGIPAREQHGMAVGCLLLIAALAGFLWFNRPPARIFMGDAGSTFLGFFLGLVGAQIAFFRIGPFVGEQTEYSLQRYVPPSMHWAWASVLAIFAVPCYDMTSVIFLRLKQGRSPFHADKQHLSHRLVERGLSKKAAVGVIYLLALASGATGLALLLVTTPLTAALVVGQLVVWWVAFAVVEWLSVRRTSSAEQPPSTGMHE